MLKMIKKVVLVSGNGQIPGKSCQTQALSFHSHVRAHSHGCPPGGRNPPNLCALLLPATQPAPCSPYRLWIPKGAPSSPLLLRSRLGHLPSEIYAIRCSPQPAPAALGLVPLPGSTGCSLGKDLGFNVFSSFYLCI